MRTQTTNYFNAIDGSASLNGSAIVASKLQTISAQAKVTGSSQGTLKLQASNDTAAIIQANSGVPANWTDIASATVTLSSATTFLLAPVSICYGYVRLVYTQTNASAGTVTVNINTFGPF